MNTHLSEFFILITKDPFCFDKIELSVIVKQCQNENEIFDMSLKLIQNTKEPLTTLKKHIKGKKKN